MRSFLHLMLSILLIGVGIGILIFYWNNIIAIPRTIFGFIGFICGSFVIGTGVFLFSLFVEEKIIERTRKKKMPH